MSDEKAIAVRDSKTLEITFTSNAIAMREQALSVSAPIGEVNDAASNQNATTAAAALQEIVKTVEKCRMAANRDLIDAQKLNNKRAADFIEPILVEQQRLAELTGSYIQLLNAQKRAEENRLRLEAERAEQLKRQEMIRIAQENAAKQAKLDAEAAEARRLANESKNAAEKKRLEQLEVDIDRQRQLSEAQSHEKMEAVQAEFDTKARQATPEAAPVKLAKGQSAVEDWDVTVSDIHALYRAHPTCVKIEPLVSEIKALLKLGITPKGVVAKEIVRVSSRQSRAINV